MQCINYTGRCLGRRITNRVKVSPLAGFAFEVTLIFPLCILTTPYAVASPSPVPFPMPFGGKKWLEDFLQIVLIDADAVIPDDDDHITPRFLKFNFNLPSSRAWPQQHF